jgi:hypothetical protein
MSIGLPVVEGVTLGRTVSLDPRAWRRHEGDTFFGLDQAELRITGQGYVQLDPNNHVHRFYTDEEIMFQAVSRSADGSGAEDITIFHGLWSHQPSTDPGRRHFIERMRKPAFEYEGVRYDRFWLPGYENDQDPVTLTEDVYEDRSGRRARQVVQVCMLYSRELEAGGTELLLALEVTPEHGALVQELMVGLPLSPAEFNA